MEFLYQIDLFLFKFVNQNTANWIFDNVMPNITDLHLNRWISIPVLIILFIVFLHKYKKIGMLYFLFLVLSISSSDFTGGKIKRIVNRPRPFQNAEAETVQRSPATDNTSFYSNHAANNFTFATYMTFAFPQTKIAFFALAMLVSYSRVYNGVHYPFDILSGAIMGLFFGWLFYMLLQNFIFYFKKDPL